MKDQFGGVIVDEFVGLKSKMYSMKKIYDKECNTAKGVSIATELNKFKDVLFNTKILRHKMRRIQSKKHKLQNLDDEIYTLAYFHKDSVISCNNKEKIKKACNKKDCEEIKKDCDN